MINKSTIVLIFFLSFYISSFGQHTASFSSEYRMAMKDSVTYEIPEICELFHIVASLTQFGKESTEIIDQSTDYYQEVVNKFSVYQNHSAVKKIQKELKRNRYNRLKMDACGYFFTDDGVIQKDATYPTLSFESKNWLEKYIQDLQDFSNTSGFREFYKLNLAIYDKLIHLQQQQLAIKSHWEWLEEKFDTKFDSYRITFSPLVYGSHSANHFIDGEYKQSIMFIGPPYITDKYPEKILEGLAGRMVFTEIDHNYINPLSNTYSAQIQMIFENLDQWNNGKYSDYSNTLSTFNEYITYGFYSLYVMDSYSKSEADIIIERCVEVMESRGFINYSGFNQQLMDYYSDYNNATATEIYEFILSNIK